MRTRSLALMLVALVALPRGGEAQHPWSVMALGGAVGFGGASHVVGDAGDNVEQFKAASTVTGGVALSRSFGRGSARVMFTYGQAGATGIVGAQSLTVSPAFTLYQVALLAGYRLLGTNDGASLQVRIGPMMQAWSGDFSLDPPTRFGGMGALDVVAPLTGSLSLEAGASLGLAPSPFREEDFQGLPVEYELRSLWTRAASVGLSLRF